MNKVGTFRDPAGSVHVFEGRVLRLIGEGGLENYKTFNDSRTVRRGIDDGMIIGADLLDDSAVRVLQQQFPLAMDAKLIVEHEPLIRTYPYEWPPEMLHEAARLTLSIARGLLHEGIGLKDATPFNILFRGTRPVFIDMLSIEKRDPLDPVWLPYAQFIRSFLLPLIANKYQGLTMERIFLSSREGLEPEDTLQLTGGLRRWLPPHLTLLTLPRLLAGRKQSTQSLYRRRSASSPEHAQYILQSQLRSLEKKLAGVRPRGVQSHWTSYMEPQGCHSPEYLAHKKNAVRRLLERCKPGRTLDIGCNRGDFSVIAAETGSSVVAVDSDPAVVGSAWRAADAEGLDILPLVINLARPSPATGWCNGECPSFLERSWGQYDMVMVLAVLHHLLVSERVPLEEIVDLVAKLSRRHVIIEYVAPSDPMFKCIVRGRESLYAHMTRDWFEERVRQRFRIESMCQCVGADRWLYFMTKMH